jgi:hypothetical protein
VSDLFDDIAISEYQPPAELRRPPIPLLLIGAVLIAGSLVMFAVDSRVGYGLAFITMILNTVMAKKDLEARADFNYVTFDWFRPASIFLKLTTLLVATGHIVLLAIESAR